MAKSRLSQLKKELNSEQKEEVDTGGMEANAPRGQRSNFLKITITMPAEILVALKTEGLKRKSTGMKDGDTSALIREAVVEWLNKHEA